MNTTSNTQIKKDDLGYYLKINKTFLRNFQKEQKTFEPLFKKHIATKENDWFFLAPKNYKKLKSLISSTIPFFKKTIQNDWEDNNQILWAEENLINKLLGKALITYTLAPTEALAYQMAKDISEKKQKEVTIYEFGCGAGISTTLTYNSIKRLTTANTQIITVDYSLTAITMTALILSLFQVPYRIISKDVLNIHKDFEGVLLVLADGITFLDGQKSSLKFDYFYSDHGIVYLSNLENLHILSSLRTHLKKDARLYMVGLYTNVFVDMSTLSKLLPILKSNNKKGFNERLKNKKPCFIWSPKSNPNYYSLKNLYIPGAGGLYDLMHELLVSKPKDFISYMKILTEVSRDLSRLSSHIKTPLELRDIDKQELKIKDMYSILNKLKYKNIKVEKFPKCVRIKQNSLPFMQLLTADI